LYETLVISEMRALGLPDPEFIEHQDFTVTFRNGQVATKGTAGPNERQQIGLLLVREHGSITSGEYCAATGAPDRTALRDLQDLVAKGLLVARGKTRGQRYFLP
jgi:predicted HTH transcriptional regulator